MTFISSIINTRDIQKSNREMNHFYTQCIISSAHNTYVSTTNEYESQSNKQICIYANVKYFWL
jgi:hypothetical protein